MTQPYPAMTPPYGAPAPRARAPRWVWWAIAGAFALGLLIGWGAGILAEAHAVTHPSASTPRQDRQDCPLPFPGNVVPPGCPTS